MIIHNDINIPSLDENNEVTDIPMIDMRSPIFSNEYQRRMKETRKFNFRGSDATFFEKAGWFLKGKNDAGKIFHRVLGIAIPVAGTILGIRTGGAADILSTITNTEQTMTTALEFSLLGLEFGWAEIFALLAIVLGFFLSYVSVKIRGLGEQLVRILKLISASLEKESEGGTKLSEKEKDAILAELAILAKLIWNGFGKAFVTKKILKLDSVTDKEAKQLE